MLLLGCRPEGRHTEQHDMFFGIAHTLSELKPAIIKFWPEAKGTIHIDAWREVRFVNNFAIKPVLRNHKTENNNTSSSAARLYFLNLGGYKQNEFEEYHYKLLAVANTPGKATASAKKSAFYKHFDIPNAPSHIDDEFGIDVDDLHDVEEILPPSDKEKYRLHITPDLSGKEDKIHLGYLKLSRL